MYHSGYSNMLWHRLTVISASGSMLSAEAGRLKYGHITHSAPPNTSSVPTSPISANSCKTMLCEWVNNTLMPLGLKPLGKLPARKPWRG